MELKKKESLLLIFIISMGSVLTTFSLILYLTSSSIENNDGGLVDDKATNSTLYLFNNLKNLAPDKLLFGHQDSTLYGLNSNGTTWINESNRSDVKALTGSYPAIFGFDIGGISNEGWETWDSFQQLVPEIKAAFSRGGITTISWHAKNFATGGSFYDTNGSVVSKIIPGGLLHNDFKSALDDIATLLGNLEDSNNISIPIIFRPWHENNGGWFWWGSPYCSVNEFKTLFQFTIEYLRDVKHVHNFLYAYSPNLPLFSFIQSNYLERYPGDDYIDILGMDAYDDSKYFSNIPILTPWKFRVSSALSAIVDLANSRGKLAAFTETGYAGGLSNCDNPNWYMEILLDAIKNNQKAKQIAYVATWRNAAFDHFWIPYTGHQNEDDFKSFYNDTFTVFENELPNIYAQSVIEDALPQDIDVITPISVVINSFVFLSLIIVIIRTFILNPKSPKRRSGK